MFMRLAGGNQNNANALLQMHPAHLNLLIEHMWNTRLNAAGVAAGLPTHRSDVPGLQVAAALPALAFAGAAAPANPFPAGGARGVITVRPPPSWDHLIYAYMIENTRIYDIFRRVLHELLHGERLGAAPSPAAQLWMRATEELFYSDPMRLSAMNVASHIRKDLGGTRRNAYLRMFNMELSHGSDDNSPYPYQRADVTNGDFASSFEELLREAWIGHAHIGAGVGPNPTDNAKIVELATKLRNMLISRRDQGNLSREEFFSVVVMSWFSLTVSIDSPVVIHLRAGAASAEERLFKIAQAVNLPAHGLSRSYFEIAQPLSEVLIAIEQGGFNNVLGAPNFYNPALVGGVGAQMLNIITHWSVITGRDIKARKVATV